MANNTSTDDIFTDRYKVQSNGSKALELSFYSSNTNKYINKDTLNRKPPRRLQDKPPMY